MVHEMQGRAVYQDGVRFEAETGTGVRIMLDGKAIEQESGDVASPLELLLSGLAGCMGVSVIGILRKMKQDVQGYELRVYGETSETYPQVFTNIEVKHELRGNVQEAAVQKAIDLAEERYCGVSAMLGKTARIEHSFSIQ